jgi:hypothetical protein
LFFEAEGAGARIDLPLDVPSTGRFEILARIAQAPDYGNYYALLDGKPLNLDNREALTSEIPTTGPAILQNYLPEIYVAMEHPLGWLQLGKGRHTLSFVCTGRDGRSAGYYLGINDVVLERIPEAGAENPSATPAGRPATAEVVYRGRPLSDYRKQLAGSTGNARAAVLRSIGAFREDAAAAASEVADSLKDSGADARIAAAWALSQMGPAGGKAVPGLTRSLADPDPLVRSMSAVALRSMGPKAVDAVPALIHALSDAEPTVRSPAADALGRIGPAAKSAVAALSERLRVDGEVIYVLRSDAMALGDIGPNAASALPALREVLKITRVTATAEEAILKITKQPVPTWY